MGSIEICHGVTVDVYDGVAVHDDGTICLNIQSTFSDEVYVYLTKDDVEKIMATFEKVE